jgi:hypothetical protein
VAPSKVTSSPAAEAAVMSWSEAAANACWFPQMNTGLDALKPLMTTVVTSAVREM